jgi:thiamine kinase-like enzyme
MCVCFVVVVVVVVVVILVWFLSLCLMRFIQPIQFIDFEYGAMNFRGFDLGNFFDECALNNEHHQAPGFALSISSYPTMEQRIEFARVYLATCHWMQTHSGSSSSSRSGSDPCPDVFRAMPLADVPFQTILAAVPAADAAALAHEGHCFCLASHFMWAIWGVCQASKSKIEFGYLEYALARWQVRFGSRIVGFVLVGCLTLFWSDV